MMWSRQYHLVVAVVLLLIHHHTLAFAPVTTKVQRQQQLLNYRNTIPSDHPIHSNNPLTSSTTRTIIQWGNNRDPRIVPKRYNNIIHPTQTTTLHPSTRLFLSISPNEIVQTLFRYNGSVPFPYAVGINIVLFGLANTKLLTALTPAGFVHAMALGIGLWTTIGWRGWTVCVLYLILGQLVTKFKFADKTKRGLAESRGGRRGPENVWGSAATGLICAICATQGNGSFLGISSDLYLLGYVASLSTKLADTFASEIGKAYGKTTFLITTLQRVPPGTEGAISAEGTAAAVLGGLLLSLYGYSVGLITSIPALIASTLSAFFATNVESIIGATLQGKSGLKWITNEVVNFINTLIGALTAMVVGKLFLGM